MSYLLYNVLFVVSQRKVKNTVFTNDELPLLSGRCSLDFHVYDTCAHLTIFSVCSQTHTVLWKWVQRVCVTPRQIQQRFFYLQTAGNSKCAIAACETLFVLVTEPHSAAVTQHNPADRRGETLSSHICQADKQKASQELVCSKVALILTRKKYFPISPTRAQSHLLSPYERRLLNAKKLLTSKHTL